MKCASPLRYTGIRLPFLAAVAICSLECSGQIRYHSGTTIADSVPLGLSSQMTYQGSVSNSMTAGSNDGSYGSGPNGAPTTASAYSLANGESILLTVSNTSPTQKARLEYLRLDFARVDSTAPRDISVSYASGDLNDPIGTELGALLNQPTIANELGNYPDFDSELRAVLIDTTLDAGESATLSITVSDATGAGRCFIDNIALSVVQENYIAPPATTLPIVATARRPNVIVFYADDLGVGDVSYNGLSTTKVSTPNIDALAATGMHFTNAHSPAGLCAPSRYALLTGNLPLRGVDFGGHFQAEQVSQVIPGQLTKANLFKSAGYRTGFVGKVHLGGGLDQHPTEGWLRGFITSVNDLGYDYSFLTHDGIQDAPYIYFEDNEPVETTTYNSLTHEWSWTIATDGSGEYAFDKDAIEGEPGYLDLDPDGDGFLGMLNKGTIGRGYWDSTRTGEMYTQAAKNFIDDHVASHSEKPFYLHYASQTVHLPHTPGSTFLGEPVGDVYAADYDNDAGGSVPLGPDGRPTDPDDLAPHLDLIHEVDLQVKALITKLQNTTVDGTSLLDNTIFIFTSDNGGLKHSRHTGHQTSGIYKGRKGSASEGGHRVPFVIRWGDGTTENSIVPPGTACEQVISQIDLFATFAVMLDKPQPSDQARDSVNILPYFLGRHNQAIRENAIMQVSGQRFVYHSGDWKLVTFSDDTNGHMPTLFDVQSTGKPGPGLYHLASDPSETTNLINNSTYQDIKNRLLAELIPKITSPTGRQGGRSAPPLDSDDDGLFDSWEKEVSGNLTTYDASLLTSTTDSDGDGILDRDEYALRINPQILDNHSVISPDIEVDTVNNKVTLGWETSDGLFYSIYESEDLSSGFPIKAAGSFVGNGSTMSTELNYNPSAPKKFYVVALDTVP